MSPAGRPLCGADVSWFYNQASKVPTTAAKSSQMAAQMQEEAASCCEQGLLCLPGKTGTGTGLWGGASAPSPTTAASPYALAPGALRALCELCELNYTHGALLSRDSGFILNEFPFCSH